MTLLDAIRDRPVRVLRIDDAVSRAQCTRFGIGEGAVIESAEKIPLGPVLVRHLNQELCLGRGLARTIVVEALEA